MPRKRTSSKDDRAKQAPDGDDDGDVGERLTLDALDAISSSDSDNGNEDDMNEEWNAEAQALRQAIADGAFNHLMKKSQSQDDKEEVKEVLLQDDDSDDQDEDDSEEESSIETKEHTAGKALMAVTEQLQSEKRGMPWAETFDVVLEDSPLPFDIKTGGNPLDVHDDLKRELAFYNAALEAVHVARKNCMDAGMPFSRPDDFFAEMVKTDDHMAKIKDRLIFENKKMDAFAQRKANKEHKLHAKEARAHKLVEKAKRKKQHFDALDKWKDSHDDSLIFNESSTKNKKRMAADKKYGFGGKRGRFKQADHRDLNDMSSFRPKGSSGAGTKWKGSSSSGKKRQGKRARDAARARR